MAEHIMMTDLSKTYSGANLALDGVSLDVAPGTFLVLLGPSGSGKTTLLRCLAGIERLSSGRLVVGDHVVAAEGVHLPPEQRNLSMVFQDYALWPHMVARDNVAFALKRRNMAKADRRVAASEMLDRVGLGALGDRYPSELSGGEQQRVALARALVADTGLVLCDEPLSNLDADLRDRMRIEISSLVRRAGATTIYITHDQAEAFALADRVGVLEHGRLVQLASPEEIYMSPATPFVARFTGLAGELPVRLRSRSRDGATVEVEPTTRSCVATFHARVSSGGLGGAGVDHGALMIRPTAVQITAPDGAPGGGDAHLVGQVTDVAFRGRGYEHAVELACGSQISGVFSDTRVERGRSVGLRIVTAGALVFARDAATIVGDELALTMPAAPPPPALGRVPLPQSDASVLTMGEVPGLSKKVAP